MSGQTSRSGAYIDSHNHFENPQSPVVVIIRPSRNQPPLAVKDIRMASANKPWAVIVGAGPSGLLLALLLAKRNIPVTVLEANSVLDDSPRAAYYGPPAAYELRRAGVIDEIRKEGFDPQVTCWRKLDKERTILGKFDCAVAIEDPDRLACMPLAQLDQLLYKHAVALPNVTVLFNHKVVSLGQDDQKAWVDVETPNGQQKFEAPYIIGCDGASSIVRRSLYGAKDFPGWTWDKQIVATNVRIARSLPVLISLTHVPRLPILLKSLDTKMSNFLLILNTGIW